MFCVFRGAIILGLNLRLHAQCPYTSNYDVISKEEYIWKETIIYTIVIISNEIHFNGNNFIKL